jgi:phosphoenolpyruvate carboxykinase (ATP)
MVRAALGGGLADAPTREDPVFGVRVPTAVPGVPPDILDPRGTWAEPDRYDAQARRMAGMFHEHFAPFAKAVDESVRGAGPRV